MEWKKLKLLVDQQMPESISLFGARRHHFVPDFQHRWLSICKHCGIRSSLEDWQLASMPTPLWACTSDEAPKVGFITRIFQFVDCFSENTHGFFLL